MTVHFTTAVIPGTTMGRDEDDAMLLLAADSTEDIQNLPVPTALHVVDNSLGLFVHGQMIDAPIPVSDTWVRAAAAVGDFDAQAKVTLLLAPLPGDIASSFVALQEGVAAPYMPVWVGDLLAGRYRMALRDMRVSTGLLGNVDMGFGVPRDVAGRATILHDPRSA
ncbi:hypothetical protein [Streptomyces sp. NPDC058671]|uniref:hypothetical protein n=1 Tax=Streptomyces sp. NPDC058671 TaxID=3346590 RepID=UPI00364BB573